MRKFIFYALGICVLCTIFLSCYDDKGNYDLKVLPDIKIDTAGLGIPAKGVIQRFDTLKCSPAVYYGEQLVVNDNDAPLDYVWTIYTTLGLGGDEETNKVDTLGRTRVLKAQINKVPGTYIVQLTVTDRENGIQQYLKFNRDVEGTIKKSGWLVLYEPSDQPGTSDLGLIYNALTKAVWLSEDVVYWDLYKSSNGAHMQGKPVEVQKPVISLANELMPGKGGDLIMMTTEEDMCGISTETFQRVFSFEDFFYEVPGVKSLTAYMRSGTGNGPNDFSDSFINDNKVYVGPNASRGRQKLGVPAIENYGKLASWLSLFHAPFAAVVYDQTNGCFLAQRRKEVKLTKFVAQTPSSAGFDVNQVGASLIAADWGGNYGMNMGPSGNKYEFFVMKNGNSYYLAQADFTRESPAMGMMWKDITSAPGIADISTFEVACEGFYAMYGSGNRVYKMMYNGENVDTENVWESSSEKEIVTCVKLQKFESAQFHCVFLPNRNSVLHIATWNEETKTGKLYQFRINVTNGNLVGEPKVYTVPGKVKSMGWKYCMQDSDTN